MSGPDPVLKKCMDPDPDPDPVCPERLDPDPVNIRPDPQPWIDVWIERKIARSVDWFIHER